MNRRDIFIIAGLLVASALGYYLLYQSKPVEVMPIRADTGSESISVEDEADNIMVIEVAGEANGTVEILLRPDLAPKHVEQIKTLVREGAYDGVAFHRVIDGFMAQTGDVEFGKVEDYNNVFAGRGASQLPDIPAEFSDVMYVEGVVGMARSADPDSANSQFFIMFTDYPSLNGEYTVIGRVISGMDVVNAIKRGEDAANGMVASDPDYMKKVTIKSDM